MAGKNKDLELRIIAKNLASKTIKGIIDDLKKFSSSTTTSMGGVNTAFTKVTGGITKIGSGLKSVGSASLNVFSGMVSGAGKVFDAIFSVKTLIMGLFAGIIGKGVMAFINLNAEFEKMKITMNVLTKGQGEVWFNKLNQWALDMPVSMAEVSKAFITMQAYGLTPTIKMMENLIDVASVLPESGRAITGIARAIGQIQSKGRLEGQELRQLAEWAVPGYEAVYDKIFKKISERTGKSVHDLKFTMIDAATANKAILETMEEHFGGAAKAIAKTWGGLWIRMSNHTKEFFRQIGEGGAMQPFRDQLENIVDWMGKAFKSGEMQKVSGIIGSSIGLAFKGTLDIFKNLSTGTIDWGGVFIKILAGIVTAMGVLTYALLQIKMSLLIIKEVWVAAALIINIGLYGIFWIIDKIVKGFKFLIDLLPDSTPGIDSMRKALSSVANFTDGIVEAQGQNITMLGQVGYETAQGIIKTGKAIGHVFGDTAFAVKELLDNYEKLNAAKAIPPSAKEPTIDTKELSEYEKERAEILNSVTSQEKGWGKGWMKDMETSIIDNASAWEQVKYAFLAYEKEGLKGATFKRFQKVFNDFTDSLKTGFSGAISGMIRGTMNLSDAVNAVTETMRASFVNIFADMVAEWIAGKTRMLLAHIFLEKAATAATVEGETERFTIKSLFAKKGLIMQIAYAIKDIIISAYQAAAGAFAAIARIPFFGPFLAIGAGAAALGTVMGFAKKVASFEKGTGLEGVRNNGPAMLHKGEIVLNKKESDAYRAGAEGGGQATSNVTNVSFSISAMDGDSVERIVRKKIIPLLRDNIRDNGRMRTAVREA